MTPKHFTVTAATLNVGGYVGRGGEGEWLCHRVLANRGVGGHLSAMRMWTQAWICLLMCVAWANSAPSPESVAVLFNSAVPESRKLAEFYSAKRGIPNANLVGLDMPVTADISRQQYEESILKPLREEFDRKRWWTRSRQGDGQLLPVSNQIRVLVTMRGVPLRIQATPQQPKTEKSEQEKVKPDNPFAGRDDASVDSELALFGVESLPTEGVLENKYFRSRQPVGAATLPFLMLTARIDGPGQDVCQRMIEDAVATERVGLWGLAYVDVAKKHPQGDGWLETVVAQNLVSGIPTVVDRFKETFPKNYPMTRASMYYGWYTWNIDGAFLNPGFKFRRGAVAVHLHSFSAEQLSDPNKNWCAGLLTRGAAVTVGNVYEPYLHLTHDLGLLHQRLMEGHSWVEACWMAMPACSWQGVVLGDPLYQPFRHLHGSGVVEAGDKPYRALRAAMVQWPGKETQRVKQLEQAATRTKQGVFHEAIGLEFVAKKRPAEAMAAFRTAKLMYPDENEKLRQSMHIVAADRAAGQNDLALRELNDAFLMFAKLPEAAAVKAWLDILQPPAKPAAGTPPP